MLKWWVVWNLWPRHGAVYLCIVWPLPAGLCRGNLVLQRIYRRCVASVSGLLRPLTPWRIDLLTENENPSSPSMALLLLSSWADFFFSDSGFTKLFSCCLCLLPVFVCLYVWLQEADTRPIRLQFASARTHTHARTRLRKHPYTLSFHLFFSTGFSHKVSPT